MLLPVQAFHGQEIEKVHYYSHEDFVYSLYTVISLVV